MKFLLTLFTAFALSISSCTEQEDTKYVDNIPGDINLLSLPHIPLPEQIGNADENDFANYLAGYVFYTNIAIEETKESFSLSTPWNPGVSRTLQTTELNDKKVAYEALYKTGMDDFYKRAAYGSIAKNGSSGKVDLYFPAVTGADPETGDRLQWKDADGKLRLTHDISSPPMELSYSYTEATQTWKLIASLNHAKQFEFVWNQQGEGHYQEFDQTGKTTTTGRWQ